MLGTVHQTHDPQHLVAGMAGGDELLDALQLLDETDEDRVERRVVGQRVRIELAGPQLRRGRLVDGRGRDADPVPVAVTCQRVDLALEHILEWCEPARHVAVEGRISHGVLRLVPGGQHDRSAFVRQRHQEQTPQPRLEVLVGDATAPHSIEPGHDESLERRGGRCEGRPDGQGLASDPEESREVQRIVDGVCGRVRRGHRDPEHRIRAERIDRERSGDGGVDTTGESDDRLTEPVAAAVVAGREHECGPQLLVRIERGYCPSRHECRPLTLCALARQVDAREVEDEQVLGELCATGHDRTGRIGDHRVPVEDDLVLPADAVDVGDPHAVGRGVLTDPRLPIDALAAVVGGGVEHDDHACACGDAQVKRSRCGPEVLTDDDADRDASDIDDERLCTGHEVARLVEHALVGQAHLVVVAGDGALDEDRGSVRQPACGGGDAPAVGVRRAPTATHGADHRDRAARSGGGQACQPAVGGRQQVGAEQQVVRGIADEGELGQDDEVGLERSGPFPHVGDAGRVRSDVTDGGADLAQCDAQQRHGRPHRAGCRNTDEMRDQRSGNGLSLRS